MVRRREALTNDGRAVELARSDVMINADEFGFALDCLTWPADDARAG